MFGKVIMKNVNKDKQAYNSIPNTQNNIACTLLHNSLTSHMDALYLLALSLPVSLSPPISLKVPH